MRVLWVSLVLLVLDQLTKTWVHQAMYPGESILLLGDWLKLTYTTNPGMAFGLTLGSKLFLTLFSIAATALITGYLWVVRQGSLGYRLALALIVGGALGNIIDRVFYGLVYGTGPLFYGEVIDFIHVDLWRGTLDLPLLGPKYFTLFPIWNVADMAIVVGVAAIILFQRRFHRQMEEAAAARKAEAGGQRAEDGERKTEDGGEAAVPPVEGRQNGGAPETLPEAPEDSAGAERS